MSDTLTTALEHPANDLRDLYTDHYPEAHTTRGRTAAAWRGGDGLNVSINSRTMHDFVSGESYNALTFLNEIVGYSKEEAAAYLIAQAGLVDEVAVRKAARREKREKSQKARAEAVKAKCLAEALEVQRTAPTEGVSAYLERKGVAAIFKTHKVAPAVLPTGETVPGLVYSADDYGPFVQVVLRELRGTITGFQRLYDGDRGKRFIYGSKPKGAFILLEPNGQTLPGSGEALAGMQERGYEVGICEGFATGASIALARPRAFVLCATSAGNLAPVAAALRKTYGRTRTLKVNRAGDRKRKAIDLCVWADFDESGTGQGAAHRAALEHDCYVRVPKFKSGYGDFNDLQAAKGLEAVRRTRKMTPDAALAFAKELGKQKLNPDKHLAPFALPDTGTALIVRAPQETGKTHRLAELLTDSGLRVLVVTHRESLAKNLAARLRFESYQDYPAHLLRSISRLVICFDSLQKLSIGGDLPSYDVLVLDESEQVLEHTTGRHIKRKAANFGTLEHYLKTAPRIICADADAGRLTADTLRHFNPERRITWQRHEHHIAAGRRLRFVFERDDVLDALEGEQRPTWYATDSLRHTRDLSAYLGDPGTLTINSETATTIPATEYLLDPTRKAPAHRRMIASPSVQTGLSDDSGHWQHVMGSFTGHSSTPQDAMQALMRARRVQELTVHAARGRGEAQTVQEALDGATAVDGHEAEGLGQDTYGTANPNYERLRAEVEARRKSRRASYKHRLVLGAARLGYTITYDLPRDLSPDELDRRYSRLDRLKEAGLERYVRERVSAERIDETRAKELDEKYSLSQPDHFALEQYKAREFYALPDDISDSDLAEMLRQDDYKALRDRVLRYENFVEPRDVAEARARGDLDVGIIKGDAKAHLLRYDYHQRLGAVVGLHSSTESEVEAWQQKTDTLEAELHKLRAAAAGAQTRRKGEIDRNVLALERQLAQHEARTLTTTYSANSKTVKAFVAWCSKHYRALKHAGLVTATLENLKAKPLETIGDSLRRAGLAHGHDGKRGAEKSYALTFASVSTMCNYSRPRRKLWTFAQQTDVKDLDSHLLCKNSVLASATGLITPLQKVNEHATPQPSPPEAVSSKASPTGERVTPWKVPGYEALRAYVRTQDGSATRTQLLETFGWADSGNAEALAALTAYLQTPQVQGLIGGSA